MEVPRAQDRESAPDGCWPSSPKVPGIGRHRKLASRSARSLSGPVTVKAQHSERVRSGLRRITAPRTEGENELTVEKSRRFGLPSSHVIPVTVDRGQEGWSKHCRRPAG